MSAKLNKPLRISNSDTKQAVIVDANDMIVGSLDRSLGAAKIVKAANRFGDVNVYISIEKNGEYPHAVSWTWSIDLGDLNAQIVSGDCWDDEESCKADACKACEVLGLNVEGYT